MIFTVIIPWEDRDTNPEDTALEFKYNMLNQYCKLLSTYVYECFILAEFER